MITFIVLFIFWSFIKYNVSKHILEDKELKAKWDRHGMFYSMDWESRGKDGH